MGQLPVKRHTTWQNKNNAVFAIIQYLSCGFYNIFSPMLATYYSYIAKYADCLSEISDESGPPNVLDDSTVHKLVLAHHLDQVHTLGPQVTKTLGKVKSLNDKKKMTN